MDAAHNGGNSHFFFLPPIGDAVAATGEFDATRSPVVEVCALAGSQCLRPFIASFSMSGGGSDAIRVDETGQFYIVNWHTSRWQLEATTVYRIRVSIGSILLGYVDVQPRSGRAGLGTDPGVLPIASGRTLPIKFRIEDGVLGGSFQVASPVSGVPTLHVNPVDDVLGTLPWDDGDVLDAVIYRDSVLRPIWLAALRRHVPGDPLHADEIAFSTDGRVSAISLRDGTNLSTAELGLDYQLLSITMPDGRTGTTSFPFRDAPSTGTFMLGGAPTVPLAEEPEQVQLDFDVISSVDGERVTAAVLDGEWGGQFFAAVSRADGTYYNTFTLGATSASVAAIDAARQDLRDLASIADAAVHRADLLTGRSHADALGAACGSLPDADMRAACLKATAALAWPSRIAMSFLGAGAVYDQGASGQIVQASITRSASLSSPAASAAGTIAATLRVRLYQSQYLSVVQVSVPAGGLPSAYRVPIPAAIAYPNLDNAWYVGLTFGPGSSAPFSIMFHSSSPSSYDADYSSTSPRGIPFSTRLLGGQRNGNSITFPVRFGSVTFDVTLESLTGVEVLSTPNGVFQFTFSASRPRRAPGNGICMCVRG